MAKQSNVIVNYTDHLSGKTQQKTITDINPQASNAKLATWGQMTLGLTKDNYGKTTRIDKIDCDNVNQRTVSLFQYQVGSVSFTNVPADGIINLTTAQAISGGSARFIFKLRMNDMAFIPTLEYSSTSNNVISDTEVQYNSAKFYGSSKNLLQCGFIIIQEPLDPQVITVKLSMPATETFDVWTRTLTFNITEP